MIRARVKEASPYNLAGLMDLLPVPQDRRSDHCGVEKRLGFLLDAV